MLNKFRVAIPLALIMLFCFAGIALADDYTIPVVVDGKTYTITVTVENGKPIGARGLSEGITAGFPTLVKSPPQIVAEQSDADIKSSAATIGYDDLFRNNERHVGKAVRYYGRIVQVDTVTCFFCSKDEYVMRVAINNNLNQIIWVNYAGETRFLEDDLVTVWGTVQGLRRYRAVLGNNITIPEIDAVDVVLGNVSNLVRTAPAGAPAANRNANLRGGPGTNFDVIGGVRSGQALNVVGKSADGSWLKLDNGAWIAASLVNNVPGDLPVVQ